MCAASLSGRHHPGRRGRSDDYFSGLLPSVSNKAEKSAVAAESAGSMSGTRRIDLRDEVDR